GTPLALPPQPAGLARADGDLLGVADPTHGRAAADVHHPHLARRQPQGGHLALPGDQLNGGTGRAAELRAATGPHLHRVHCGADRHVAQRQVVAGLDGGRITGLHRGALLQPVRGDDVALLAVPVVQQRDAGSAVRVVLDVGDLRRDAVLVVATEVDHPVGLLVAATDVAGGDPAAVVATA